jgi:antitoxin HigA-1
VRHTENLSRRCDRTRHNVQTRPSHAEYGLSQNKLAKAIGISPNRIAEIVNNRRRITADTALRVGLYFGNSPEFWLNLQIHYDLKIARKNLKPQAAARIKASRAA